MAKIFDCFLYNNEIELLELRLKLLSAYVDYFVIGWSPYTFTGLLKSEAFPCDMPIMQELGDRVKVVEIERIKAGNAWERESFSRNALMSGILAADADDVVIISDVDEIPRPSSIELLMGKLDIDEPVVFVQDYFNFKFNYQLVHGLHSIWAGPVAQKVCAISTLQSLRSQRWELLARSSRAILGAGWHFSFLAKTGSVEEKLLHFSHQEREVQERASENVGALLASRVGFHDHLHGGSVWAVVELASMGCKELAELVACYPHLIADGAPDSEHEIATKMKFSIWNLYANEKHKVLRSCSGRELHAELWRRFIGKLSRFTS